MGRTVGSQEPSWGTAPRDAQGAVVRPLPVAEGDGRHLDGLDQKDQRRAELARLASLHRYRLIDREIGPALESLVRLATRLCRFPMGAVNLIDADRQLQVAAVGTERRDAPRDASFCDVTIGAAEPVVVADATQDPRFADRAFTTGKLGSLRAYAGAQLTTPEGHNIGALCVFDETARQVGQEEVEILQSLADQAMALIGSHDELVQLTEAEQRFRLAFMNAPVGMALVGLDGCFLQTNSAMSALVGFDQDQLIGVPFNERTHPEDLERELRYLEELIDGERANYRLEKRYLHRDGHHVWVELWASLVRDVDGVPTYVIKQVEDITVRKQVEMGLVHQAMHDSLTGLPNRALLADRLQQAVGSQARGGCLRVFSLDLDRFKQVNDTHGHAAGDQVLIEVGRRLRAHVRPEDTVARLGGDEFVVVSHMPSEGLEQAHSLAERLVSALREPIVCSAGTMQVGATIGGVVVTDSTRELQPAELLDRSDSALYRAKHHLRGSVELDHYAVSVGH